MAFVQSEFNENGAGSTTIAQAFASNVTAGNLIVIAFSRDTGSTASVADTLGNTYARAFEVDEIQHIEVWYARNIAGGACTTTVTFSASQANRRLAIHEYSSMDTSASVLDAATGRREAAGTTTPSSGNITPSVDGCLIFGAMTPTQNAVTTTPGTGYTEREESPTDGFQSEDRTQATAAAIAATWTISLSDRPDCIVAAFRPASGGGTSILRQIMNYEGM